MLSCKSCAQTKYIQCLRVKTGSPLKDEMGWMVLVASPLGQEVQGPGKDKVSATNVVNLGFMRLLRVYSHFSKL